MGSVRPCVDDITWVYSISLQLIHLRISESVDMDMLHGYCMDIAWIYTLAFVSVRASTTACICSTPPAPSRPSAFSAPARLHRALPFSADDVTASSPGDERGLLSLCHRGRGRVPLTDWHGEPTPRGTGRQAPPPVVIELWRGLCTTNSHSCATLRGRAARRSRRNAPRSPRSSTTESGAGV